MNIWYDNEPSYLVVEVLDDSFKPQTGLTVSYSIYDSVTGGLVETGTMAEENALYKKEVVLEVGRYYVIYTTPDGYEDGSEEIDVQDYDNFKADVSALALESTVQSIKVDVELIKEIESGTWKIISNQMIFYKPDGTTELMRFNLFDLGGNPTMEAVAERLRI